MPGDRVGFVSQTLRLLGAITAVGGAERTGPRGNRLLDTIEDMMRAWYRFVVLAGILPFWRVAIPGPGKHRDDIR